MDPLSSKSIDVTMDIVNQCNLRCIMCHFTFDHVFNRKATVMAPESFEKILDAIQPYARKLTLSASYEPLVSRHAAKIFEQCADADIPEKAFLTNGTLLTEKISQSVVQGRITDICLSMHAATESSYNRIVKGGNFKKVHRNIALLSALKRGAETPRLRFYVALMKSNIRELEKIVVLAHRLGAVSVSFRHLILFEGLGMENESLALSAADRALSNYWIHRALEKAAGLGIAVLNCPDFFDKASGPTFETPVSIYRFFSDHFTDRKLARLAPIGNMDTPDGEEFGMQETIEFSGWALSTSGAPEVILKLVYPDGDQEDLGRAEFHNATRAYISGVYPQFPQSYRSGWTFLFKPGEHPLKDSTFIVHALATDRWQRQVCIGKKKIRIIRGKARTPYLSCTKPFDSLYIDVHGSVFPYPDCHTDTPFGSLLDSSLPRIWSSGPMAALREAITRGERPDFCVRCPVFINRQVDSAEFFRPHKDFSSEHSR